MHASSRQGEFGLAPPNSIVHTGSTALGDTLGAPDGRVVGLEEGDGVANGDVLGVTVLPKVVHPPLAGAEAQNHARYSLHAADDGSATQAAAKQGESDAAPKSVKQSPTLGEGLGAALGAALGNALGACDGLAVGLAEGLVEGAGDGDVEGASVIPSSENALQPS